MRRAVLPAALLALCLPSVAQAEAAWTPPARVSGSATSVFGPQPVVTAGGDAVVGFGLGAGGGSRFGFGVEGDPGTFGAPVVTTTTDPAARVLPYGQGSLLIVSETLGRLPHLLKARTSAADGSRPRTTATLMPGADAGPYSASIAQDGAGIVAAVVYVRDSGRPAIIRRRELRVVRRPGPAPWARPETIAGKGNPNAVAAYASASGELLVAYERSGRVVVRTRAPGGHWSAPQDLGPGAKGHTQLSVVADRRGHAVVAWFSQALSEGGDNGSASVRVTERLTGHTRFGSFRLLESFTQRAPDGARVIAAMDAGGTATVGWTGRASGVFTAKAARLSDAVRQVLPPLGVAAVLGDLAVAPDGAAAAVWTPPLDTPSPSVSASLRPAGGDVFAETPEDVSGPQLEVADARVAADPSAGGFLAAWTARVERTTSAVFASRRVG